MILSRNMAKSVGESRHPCQTPTVVWNQSPMLPFKGTALVALSKSSLMTRVRLALMLYFFMVAHKAACQTLSKASWSLGRHGRGLAGVGDVSHKGFLSWISALWCSFLLWNLPFFSDDLFHSRIQSVHYDLQHDFAWKADKADHSVVLALL